MATRKISIKFIIIQFIFVAKWCRGARNAEKNAANV